MKRTIFALTLLLSFTVALAADKPVVTIMDFQVNSISEGDMKSIVSFLSASLHDTGKYTVIDTAQRDMILEELAFSNSGCTDESCQLEIGKLLSAEYIVTGDIAFVGERFILSARMLETETSATMNTAKGIYPDLGSLIDEMPVFASELSGEKADSVDPVKENPIPKNSVPGQITGREIAAWSTLGGGVIAAGIGGYLLYSAFDFKTSTVDPAFNDYNNDSTSSYETSAVDYYNTLWSAYETAYNEFVGKVTIASILAGVGLVSIGTSVYLFFTDTPQLREGADISFMLTPAPDKVTLSCRIRR